MPQVFTTDVSIHFRTAGERHLPPAGTPCLRFLEVGVHEGRSACWFLDRYPGSAYVGIDPWRGTDTRDRARKNLAPYGERVMLLRDESMTALPRLVREVGLGYFDVIHIDGLHTVPVALLDGLLAWPMLAMGGLMAFDDLLHGERVCVQQAFDLFVLATCGLEVLERARQGWVRKLRGVSEVA